MKIFANYLVYSLLCGDAGNRTRVQTSSTNAFYMLSSLLVFDQQPAKNSLLLT